MSVEYALWMHVPGSGPEVVERDFWSDTDIRLSELLKHEQWKCETGAYSEGVKVWVAPVRDECVGGYGHGKA